MTPMAANTVFLEHFDHLLATPDAVGRLNQAILDLAVRGKLVEQDPNDEPASELLKRLREEKKRLREEGLIKDGNALPPVDDNEQYFTLPRGWAWCRLGDTGDWGAGATPDRSNLDYYDNGTIPWLKTGELNDGHIRSSEEYVTELAFKETSLRMNKPGDVLMAMYGATIGKLGILDIVATTNQACCACTPFTGVYNTFLFYYLLSIRPKFRAAGAGGAQPNISKQKIVSTPFPLPPFAEQHRIVARVEQLFAQTHRLAELLSKAQTDLTHLNEAALHHLLVADTSADFNARWDFIAAHFDLLYSEPEHIAPLRQAVLELAVRGKLTRQDSNDEPASELLKRIKTEKARLVEEGEIAKSKPLPPVHDDEKSIALPEGWEWVRLDSILIALQTGPFGSNLHKSDYVAGGIPVVNPSNMQDSRIVANPDMTISEETRQRLSQYTLQVGDVVVARRGEMGRCALVTEKEAGWLCGTGSLRMQLSNHLLKDYILRLFQTELARSHLVEGSVGITMSNLGQDTLLRLPIALPPLAEQQRIVARVEQLLGRCDALAAKLQAAQVERERLVAAVVAGVADPHPIQIRIGRGIAGADDQSTNAIPAL